MIWPILITGLILRLISLNQSLWLDEAINVLAAKNYSLINLLTQYARADFHPPGYFFLLWVWGRLFNFSEVSMRMPSVIFGVLTIWLIYLIGGKLVSKSFGLIAALLLAINPLHIYYSQEARMYAFAAFAVSLNFFLFIKLLKKENINYLFLSLSNFLILVSDYVAYLVIPAQLVFLLLKRQNQVLKKWSISIFISGFIGMFWLPIFLIQLNIGLLGSSNVPAWKMVVGSFGLKPISLTFVKFIIGRISYPDFLIYAAIFLPIGTFFALLIFRGVKFSNIFTRNLLLIWLIIPIILASLISLVIPVYSYFRLLFILPSFILLISFGIFSFKSNIKYILELVVLIELVCSAIYLFNPSFQREDWRGLVNFLKTKSNNSEILFESSGSFLPFDYYANNQLKAIGALKKFPAKNQDDLIDLETDLKGLNEIYLINYFVEIADPNRLVQKELNDLNYKQVDIENFNGVGFVYHYVK